MEQISNLIKFSSTGFLPLEEKSRRNNNQQKLTIGIPKETDAFENRVPLIPQSVGLLVANGYKVLIEEEAAYAAGFSNDDYLAVGGEIANTPLEVFNSDIICKVAPPSREEVQWMGKRKILISALNLTQQDKAFFQALKEGKHTCFSYEYIRDKSGIHPVVHGISEITGTSVMYIAAELMAGSQFGKGRLLGGFPGIAPTEVVVLGAGTVAEYTIRTAISLGASVKVFDNSLYRLRRIRNLVGKGIYTSTIQPDIMRTALHNADVVVGAMYSRTALSPLLVSEEMVCEMKEGAVIVDVSIDQGGCFETSYATNHDKPTFVKCGVTHYCVPNIASRYPLTGSQVLSNSLTDILLKIGEAGSAENSIRFDEGLRNGVYLYHGIITKPQIGNYFQFSYQDINLLLTAL
jgi:alanine dehydrogenase